MEHLNHLKRLNNFFKELLYLFLPLEPISEILWTQNLKPIGHYYNLFCVGMGLFCIFICIFIIR